MITDVEFEATENSMNRARHVFMASAHFSWLSEKGLGAVQRPQLAHALGSVASEEIISVGCC